MRNVTDRVGRGDMDSCPWLSHPRMASLFTQYTIEEDKVRCSQVVSCSPGNTDDRLPMYSYFTTDSLVMPGLTSRLNDVEASMGLT